MAKAPKSSTPAFEVLSGELHKDNWASRQVSLRLLPERIELAASSKVDGTLSAERVVIADGARFNGSVDMGRRTIATKMAPADTPTLKAVSGAVASPLSSPSIW